MEAANWVSMKQCPCSFNDDPDPAKSLNADLDLDPC
jgi:hypothetical protein